MNGFLNKLVTQTAMTVVMLLMVFAPFASLTAQAQFDSGNAAVSPATTGNGVQTVAGGAGAGGTVSTSAQQQTSNDILANCKNFSVSGCVASMLYVFTVGIGSAFAYVAAYFFDITVQLSLNGASYGLDFISTSWTTARDLANMAFLFILIYIAFTIILRADTSGTMSLLAGVIIVALLVNFSFFFSRVIIDAGNILSIQFYNAIPAPPISQTIQGTPIAGTVANGVNTAASFVFSGDPTKTKDLTASIMNMIQVQNLLNNQSFNAANGSGTFNLISTIFIFIAAAIVLWLLTVAFITNGVKLLVRVVVLWFLIIVSPFAFVAAAVQGVGKGYFPQWRKMLLEHAFYPVAFMFIFLILNNFAITISGGNSSLVSGVFSTGTNLTTWSQIGASLVSIAIRVGLVIAVLFVGMRASDRISVYGASAAGKIGGWFGDKYKNTFSYAGGALYRNTGGRAANAIDNSVKNSRWANTPGTLGGVLGYRLRKNVLAPAKATSLGTVASSFDERQKFLKERKGEMGDNLRSRQNKDDLGWMIKQSKDYDAAKKKAFAARTTDEQALVDEGDRIKTRMKGFGEKDFESIKFSDIKSMVNVITENQLKTLSSGKKLSEQEKEELTTEWNTKNSGSAYQKANKEVDELRSIAKELHTAGIVLSQIDTHLGGASTPNKSGALVTKDIVKDIQKEAKKRMAKLDNEIAQDTRSGVDTTDKRESKDKLKDAIDHMTKLATATGDVQANIGGEKEEGKFRTK